LCWRSVCSATPTGSRSKIRRFIKSHPSALFYGQCRQKVSRPLPLNPPF
jgi:hypothetical protein